MNLGMARNPLKVVLDTNILISALVYGGKPEQIYNLVLEKQMIAITTNILIAELLENLTKKFNFEQGRIEQLGRIIKKHFNVVHPKDIIKVIRDEDDNRVLEAAIAGNCEVIITGDRDLLDLGNFEDVEILTPEEFLEKFKF